MEHEQSIFVAALDKSSAERDAFLAAACAGDDSLRARVERLLAADDQTGILEREADPAFTSPTLTPGRVFARRFTLREKLGEGGMGEVWVAEQREPVRRSVALKVVRPGLDSQSVLARFEQERQALALMDHPNIAKVFDAGVGEYGRPYFVMEHIPGVAITDYCDSVRLSPRQRVELFVPVCQAVQHAHQKGIIHRDLKPANILVGLYDGRPVPKVIDFGVAKATGPRLGDDPAHTEVGSLIGTLEYMSPEQAERSNLDIDTRTDVYALGVVLYELLAGSVPFSRKSLQSAAFAEMLRVIREVDPPRPSTRLSDSGTLPNIAAVRQSEPRRLVGQVRGDLDWIVMRCLEKDRARRYETANGLGMDLQRFLADEPVTAGPPSARYRLRKFARRNRGAVAATALVLMALVGGVIGTTLGLVEARRQRDAANAAEGLASRRLEQVQLGFATLGSILTDLDPKVEPSKGRPVPELLGQRLREVAQRLNTDAIADPITAANLRTIVGRTLLSLGYSEEAADAFAKAHQSMEGQFGPDDDRVLELRSYLAIAYRDTGKTALALPLEVETLSRRRARPAGTTEDLLWTMRNLARLHQIGGRPEQAKQLLEEALSIAEDRLGRDARATLNVVASLADLYRAAGRQDLAMPLTRRAYEASKAKRGPDHPDSLTLGGELAHTLMLGGQPGAAIDLYEDLLRRRRAILERDHPETLANANDLGLAYMEAGKLDLAVPLLEDTLKLRRRRLPPDDSRIQISVSNLALARQRGGQHAEAIPLFEEALATYRRQPGADPATAWVMMNNFAASLQAVGKLDRAAPLLEEAVAGIEGVKFQHRYADRIVRRLCDVYEGQRQFAKAEALRRRWLAEVASRHGTASLEHAAERTSLGWNLVQQGRWTAAAEELRAALAVRAQKQPNEWTTFNTESVLGEALIGLKDFGTAEKHLLAAYNGMKAREAKIPPIAKVRLTQALDRLVQLYEAWGKPAEAERWRKVRAANTK